MALPKTYNTPASLLPFPQLRCSPKSEILVGRLRAFGGVDSKSPKLFGFISYKKEKNIRNLSISIASPNDIIRWSERILPNGKIIGKVTNANTRHYKTFKPNKGGLFCERIFGPLKDFECACGVIQRSHSPSPPVASAISLNELSAVMSRRSALQVITPKKERDVFDQIFKDIPYQRDADSTISLQPLQKKYCLKCDVQYTWCKLRRLQLGYIELTLPVTHVWYLKGTTSLLGNLFGLKKKVVQSIAYNSEQTVLEISQKAIEKSKTDNPSPMISNLSATPASLQNKKKSAALPRRAMGAALPRRAMGASAVPEESYLLPPFAEATQFFRATPSYSCSKIRSYPKGRFRRLADKMCPGSPPFSQRARRAGRMSLQNSIKSSPFILNQRSEVTCPSGHTFRECFAGAMQRGCMAPAHVSLEIRERAQNNGPATNNNFFQFSFIQRWFDSFHFQSILFFLTSAVGFKDKMIAYAVTLPNGERLRGGVPQNEARFTFRFSGAGLLQIILSKFSPGICLAQNLVDLKSLLQKLIELQTLQRDNLPAQRAALPKILISGEQLITKLTFLGEPRHVVSYLKQKITSVKVIRQKITKLKQVKPKLIKRIKLLQLFEKKKSIPDSIILKIIPVLPPDLRPILKNGDKMTVSDLNRLYQKIIYRNNRLKKLLKEAATTQSEATRFAHRLLQEAVDNLIENGKSGVKPENDSRGRAFKSLSVILKGKSGRFRQHLLGKRVDYSGRSVIVVGPYLKMHECGIPYDMAIELFLPFLLKRIIGQGLSQTVVGAKTVLRTNKAFTKNVLREIMRGKPVLLNRAPTLHRLGIQAFFPILVDGKAIIIHPLVCTAFNADFDGDQMGVHVPLTVEARAEALKLMFARNNLLSPATGEPLASPSQDMLLGIYYLTIDKPQPRGVADKSLKGNPGGLCIALPAEAGVPSLLPILLRGVASASTKSPAGGVAAATRELIGGQNSRIVLPKIRSFSERLLKQPHLPKGGLIHKTHFYFNSKNAVFQKHNLKKILPLLLLQQVSFFTAEAAPKRDYVGGQLQQFAGVASASSLPGREDKLHSNIWVKSERLHVPLLGNRTGLLSLRGKAVAGKNVQTGKQMTQPVELRQHLFGNRQEIFPKLLRNLDKNNYSHTKYVRTTPGQILFNLLIQRSLPARLL
jgi:DNA-directed RNA polymerase beta' subunit